MKKLLLAIVILGLVACAEKESAPRVEIKNMVVVLETSHGAIEIKLKTDVAPLACQNFIGLVKSGYYDGIIFHRVINDFMIQGGDPEGTGRGGESIWGEPFEDEVDFSVIFDRPGLVAMANRGPDTNGSQFFITTKSSPGLDMRHTIFGEVIAGYDVVKAIERESTDSNDRPIDPQVIERAYLKR